MTDIQQWMRKTIQPVRTRTPTLPSMSEERRNTGDTSSISESNTPRRRSGPRQKITSYFSYRSSKYAEDAAANVWASDAPAHDASAPDIVTMVDSIFTRLCSEPFNGLPVQMNSSVLHVIEAYRKLAAGQDALEEQLDGVTARLEETVKKWEQEEAAFWAEIKRLELVIAKEKNGMSKLMACRQESVINRGRNPKGPSNSIIEAQAKAQSKTQGDVHDGVHGEARGKLTNCKENMRIGHKAPSMSPSSKERALSEQLCSAVHQEIPVGTPPQGNVANTLGRVSGFPNGLKGSLLQGRPSFSNGEEVFAETTAAYNTSGRNMPAELEEPETLLRDDIARDLHAVKVMASAIAANRGLRVEYVLPKLIELFDSAEEHVEMSRTVETAQAGPGPPDRRPPSWIPGDDTTAWRDTDACPTIRPPLRTINSFASSRRDALSDLSASSSDESDSASAVKPSKIPSPTHENGLARARPEQHSSVVTVVLGGGRSEAETLSSSTGSRTTAFRNSCDRLEALPPSSTQAHRRSQTHNGRLPPAPAAQGGATSSPDAPTAASTTPRESSPPAPATGRTSGQRPLRQKTNQVDSAAGIAAARAGGSSESRVSRTGPAQDGERRSSNNK